MSPKLLAKTLLNGAGYFHLPALLSKTQVRTAREIILSHSSQENQRVTHFQGKNKAQLGRQRRVWNLLNKGSVFVDLVQLPAVIAVMKEFLGDEFCLGSIAANRLLPQGPGQEPHIDYPYWDYYKKNSFPKNMNSSFALNCQVTIMLDDFTVENGATALAPHTQKECEYPTDEAEFHRRAIRTTGKAGDVVVFNGLCWHCAMPNNSKGDRTAVLIQYLPKFVKPMEDQIRGTKKEIKAAASPLLRQLLGMHYPYPQLLDEAEVENSEGLH